MLYLLSILIFLAGSVNLFAKVQTETIEYRHGDTLLEGYLAYDDGIKGKRPAVLVVHDWWGVGPFVKRQAEELAKLGYTALAIDMYGKGIKPKDAEEAQTQATIYRKDRQLMRSRANAGLEVLKKHRLTDPTRIAAIGYCFGGGTVLEMARSGADLAGAVSFHGNLDTPNPADARNIKGKVLVLHGGDDPFVPSDQVVAFQDEMRKAGVDWQMVIYGGAVHSFTIPGAGSDNSKGVAYNEKADKRSWEAMRQFFTELFK